ncbi:MAG: hypothetical protein JW987_12270 [Anaerolineaceae bacterium]|nr:hypothetical protein [Anaerolineaceae bacterium]
MNKNKMNLWKKQHSFSLLVILGAAVGFGLQPLTKDILITWGINLALLALFTLVAGHGITGRWSGWLINEQFRMSLSRLQMSLWTIVVLSAFLTMVSNNIRTGNFSTALDIKIPEELWVAMGISTVSLVGTPLILQTKRDKKTNEKAAEKTSVHLGLLDKSTLEIAKDPSKKDSVAIDKVKKVIENHTYGQLMVNESPKDAQLADLIRGEEVGNAATLDLTRLQNLFFTLILVGTYTALLANGLAKDPNITAFPQFSDSGNALLAISHAGYLAGKSVDKQSEGENK